MNNQQKYYGVRKKSLADAINFLTGLRYYVFDDKLDTNNKIYSFENTELFQQALTEITNLQNKLNKYNK